MLRKELSHKSTKIVKVKEAISPFGPLMLNGNIKQDVNGAGVIKLSITSVDSDTDEFAGTFEAIQPSDTDMGSKDPLDVKIIGELYGKKA